jgi:hypothetical protein
MQRSKLIFHPVSVAVCAALAVLAYVAWMRWRLPGGDLSKHFFYVLPIIVPFVSFLFDRFEQFTELRLAEMTIDFLVVVTSIMRALGDLPFVSGHALFLVYAMARPGSRFTRLTAAIVMIQVIYLKFFVWHDLITPVTGTMLALLAAFMVRRLGTRTRSIESLTPVPNSE